MGDALFHLIAIIVATMGILRGYHRGLTGMVTSVLGMALGIVCAHIFVDISTEFCLGFVSGIKSQTEARYLASNLGCGMVYGMVYMLFKSVTGIIRKAMTDSGAGLLNSIIGALFCVVNYMLMLSIAYNIYVGLNPHSSLMKYGRADDGNICSVVMWLAPAALGSETFADFAHEEQLEEAKKISFNHRRSGCVIKSPEDSSV